MTTIPGDLDRKRPASIVRRPAKPPTRREPRVIDGTAWERRGIVSGRLLAWLVLCLFSGAGFFGLLLSLMTQTP